MFMSNLCFKKGFVSLVTLVALMGASHAVLAGGGKEKNTSVEVKIEEWENKILQHSNVSKGRYLKRPVKNDEGAKKTSKQKDLTAEVKDPAGFMSVLAIRPSLIIEKLDARSVASLEMTSRPLRTLVNKSSIWKDLKKELRAHKINPLKDVAIADVEEHLFHKFYQDYKEFFEDLEEESDISIDYYRFQFEMFKRTAMVNSILSRPSLEK